MNYEELRKMVSIPLKDGTRLDIGECFTVEDEYPFFSLGYENYNAELSWCDNSKSLWFDLYKVSNRVRGCAGGMSVDDIDWNKIRRRKKR